MYKITNYGRNRTNGKYSIDRHSSKDGDYIYQVAAFFKTEAKAEARLAEIIDEDWEEAQKGQLGIAHYFQLI